MGISAMPHGGILQILYILIERRLLCASGLRIELAL